MGIQESVKGAIKEAMVAKDKATLQTLRMLTAAFKQIEIDKQIEVTDEVALNELVRQVKQRQDAARQFRDTGRDDLAEKEELEIQIIHRFLPQQMNIEEMQMYVQKVLEESGLQREIASLGQLMPQLKAELQGRADMSEVSKYLRQLLST